MMISKLFKSKTKQALEDMIVEYNRQVSRCVKLSLGMNELQDEVDRLNRENTALRVMLVEMIKRKEEVETELTLLSEDFFELLEYLDDNDDDVEELTMENDLLN